MTTLEIGMLGAILLPVAGAIALVIADAQPGASALSSRTIALVASLLGALSIALVGASLAADGGVAITGRAAAEGSVARIARETLSRLLRADGPGTFLAAWAAIVAFVTLDLETSSTRDAAGVRSPGGLSRRGRLRVAVILSMQAALAASFFAIDAIAWWASYELAGLGLLALLISSTASSRDERSRGPNEAREPLPIPPRLSTHASVHALGSGALILALVWATAHASGVGNSATATFGSVGLPTVEPRAPLGTLLLVLGLIGLAARATVAPFHRAADGFRVDSRAALLAFGAVLGAGVWGLERFLAPLALERVAGGAERTADLLRTGLHVAALFAAALALAADDDKQRLARGIAAHLALAFAAVLESAPATAAAASLHVAAVGCAAGMRIAVPPVPRVEMKDRPAGSRIEPRIARLAWIGFPGTAIFASGLALLRALGDISPGRAAIAALTLALAGASVFRGARSDGAVHASDDLAPAASHRSRLAFGVLVLANIAIAVFGSSIVDGRIDGRNDATASETPSTVENASRGDRGP